MSGPPERLLDPGLAVSVESISKAYSGVHEARYRPVVSVFAHLRERRSGANGTITPDVVDVVDEEDEDEDAEELLPARESGAELEDVSFEVRRGEAVGVSGSTDAAARTMARILCGMTSPTSGRILVRGRVAPSIELATYLAQRETSSRGVAQRLAALAGPGRRHHNEFVRAALALAFGESQADADLARPGKNVLRRVAAAAAFDPTADVLVIDALPELGDPDFPRRCRERLVERLASGAGVVVTAPDATLLADLCSRVVSIEAGRVAGIVSTDEPEESAAEPAAEPAPPTPPAPAAPPVRTKPELRTANEHVALRSFALLGLDGAPLEDARSDDWIVARTDFELAADAPVKLVVRLVGAEDLTFVEKGVLGGGAYVATLRLPPGAVPAGEYDVAVGVILERESGRIKVGHRVAARLRIDDDDSALVAAAEAGAALARASVFEAADAEWSLDAV